MTGLPTLATDLFPAPTAVSITEAMFGDAMQKAYTNGATPTLLSCRRGRSGRFRLLWVESTTQVLVGKTEVVSTVDVIATDFGRIKVIPSRWLPVDVGLLDRSGLSRGCVLQVALDSI